MARMADLAITGARLLDGTGAPPVGDALVAVEDGRIVYAGPAAAAPPGVAKAAKTLDARGRTLIPGLIDCHVHICFDGSPDFEEFAARVTVESSRALARENLVRALEGGVTTVRDLGGVGDASLEAARAQRNGDIPGARVVTAGGVLTSPGGHAHFIGTEVSSAAQMAKEVARLHEAGAECIKIVATGGVLTRGIGATQTQFTVEEMRAAVDEAHARGMRVAAHAIGTGGIEAAVEAGVDSIEHGCFLSDAAIARMMTNPTWLVATLSAPDRISNGGDGVPEYARKKSAEVQVQHFASFARAYEAGARIASGTDAGTPYNYIGQLYYELALMHRAGMPLDRLLPAATRDAARLLGLDATIGTVEVGKIADLVLLDGDPLSDVAAYSRAAAVVQSGRVAVDRT
jgi:imidazolonepropionase-like amidohydrolase